MEQYEIAKTRYYGDIGFCLQNFKPERIFIRPIGSREHEVKSRLDENLTNKKLNLRKVKEGLMIVIDDSEVFLFNQNKEWGHKFSVAYERFPNDKGVIPMLSTGINPDDTTLPPVRISSFRCANYDHMLYLDFKGKIPLKFHSWYDQDKIWKYWQVDRNLKKR